MRTPAVTNLMQLATGYWASAALGAAVDLGLFDALADGPASAADVADRLETDPRYTAALLDALVGLDLLDRRVDSDRYAIAGDYRDLLTPGGDRCMLDALRFNLDLQPLWARLDDAVRSGEPLAPAGGHLGRDPAATRRFVMGMHSRALGLADLIVPAIDVDGIEPDDTDPADQRLRLLDVGAGPGTFSRRFAESHARWAVTQLDLSAVVAVARELTADSPAADRIGFVEADYRRGELSGAYDAVLYCGALHQESPESAAALFNKLHGVLRPGGRLFVIDLMTEPDHAHPPFAALFGLNMMLISPDARVFSVDQAGDLVQAAGFTHIRHRRLGNAPYYVLTANRAECSTDPGP